MVSNSTQWTLRVGTWFRSRGRPLTGQTLSLAELTVWVEGLSTCRFISLGAVTACLHGERGRLISTYVRGWNGKVKGACSILIKSVTDRTRCKSPRFIITHRRRNQVLSRLSDFSINTMLSYVHLFWWQHIIIEVILDFAQYACIHMYCAQTKKPLLLESNLLLHKRNECELRTRTLNAKACGNGIEESISFWI